jgi:RecB family exonuclease
VLANALAKAIEAIRRGRDLEPVTVVTPSVFSSFYLRRALATNGLFNVRFARLDDLAEVIAPLSGRKPPLTRLIASEVVVAVLRDGSVALPPELQRLREHPGLASAVHRTLDLLETAPPELLDGLARAGRIQEGVVALLRAYRGRVAAYERRIDVAERAAALLRGQTLPAGSRSGGTGGTGQSGRMGGAGQWAGVGGIVYVEAELPPPPYRTFAEAVRNLPDAVVLPAAGGWSDKMTLVSVPDPSAEVQWTVRNCMRLAREGTRFGDIAVFYDDPAYGIRLDEAFQLAGVPVSGPDPARFADHPDGRFLSGALDSLGTGDSGELTLRRDTVMAWLTGSPVTPPGARHSFHASRWDAVSRRAGVVRGLDGWRASLSGYASRLENRASAALATGEIDAPTAAAIRAEAVEARALLAFVEELAGSARPPADGAAWSAFATWARELTVRYAAGAADDSRGGERRERLDGLFDRLAQLDSVGGPGPTFERFAAVVRDELARAIRSTRALGLGVFVAPIAYAPGTAFAAVHVAGMTEGRFPSAPASDALVPEHVRRRLDPEGRWLDNRESDRTRQRARLDAALGGVGRVFLSWPRAEPGASRRSWPARWFVEAARHRSGDITLQAGGLHGSQMSQPAKDGWWGVVGNAYQAIADSLPETCADPHEYDLRSTIAWRNHRRPLEHHYLATESSGRLARGLMLARARFGGDWTEFDGNLSLRAGAGLSRAGPISATRLETWATCPFRYLLGYVLNLDALPRPEEAFMISPLDRGSLMHGILHEFFDERSRTGSTAESDRGELMRRIATAALDSAPSRYVVGKPAMWALARSEIEGALREFVVREIRREAETGLRQSHAELRFGMPGATSPAVGVDIEGVGTLAFRGVIDRAEVSKDGRRGAVIDYKTGSPAYYRGLDDDPVERGTRLQLPVYAEALRAIDPRLESVTAQYWFVGPRGRFEVLPHAGVRDSTVMAKAVRSIKQGIDSGVYIARPGPSADRGFQNCGLCDFDRLCPSARDRAWERKRASPGVSVYRSLAEPRDA